MKGITASRRVRLTGAGVPVYNPKHRLSPRTGPAPRREARGSDGTRLAGRCQGAQIMRTYFGAAASPTRIYTDRVARGHRHYSHTGGDSLPVLRERAKRAQKPVARATSSRLAWPTMMYAQDYDETLVSATTASPIPLRWYYQAGGTGMLDPSQKLTGVPVCVGGVLWGKPPGHPFRRAGQRQPLAA